MAIDFSNLLGNQQEQTSSLQSFANKYSPSGVKTGAGSGLKTAYNMTTQNVSPSMSGVAPTQKTTSGTPATSTQTQFGSPQIGMFNTYEEALAALDRQNNPKSVNMTIDNNIPSGSLNNSPSATDLEETRKGKENNILSSKYAAEEEKLLQDIGNLNDYIAKLQGMQAREYYDAKQNPTGQLRSGLNADLGRLSEEQAIELNARTGQLNAMLDTLELYQGYRPQMVGTPQVDSVTGEAFAYLQDPTTGEISIQSLGSLMTPNPYANAININGNLIDPATGESLYQDPYAGYMTIGEGQSVFNAQTGETLYKNPKTASPTTSTSSFTSFGGGLAGEMQRLIDIEGSFISSENQRSAFVNAANSYLQRGDYNGLKYYLRNQAVNNLPASEQTGYKKSIEMLKELTKAKDALDRMVEKGADTGLIQGSYQSVLRALGAQGDPDMVSLAYQASQAIDNLTRLRTGAALNKQEEDFYAKLAPGIFKSPQLNYQIIDEFNQTLESSIDSYLGLYFSPGEISSLDKAASGGTPSLEELINTLQ